MITFEDQLIKVEIEHPGEFSEQIPLVAGTETVKITAEEPVKFTVTARPSSAAIALSGAYLREATGSKYSLIFPSYQQYDE